MNKFCKIVKNKIQDTKGTSIGEMLVTVLILLLSTSVVVTTVALGCRLYIRTVSASEANELYSTLQAIISNELTYTSYVQVDDSGNVKAIQSQNYGVVGTFGPLGTTPESYGKATLGEVEILGGDGAEGKGSYPHNIGVRIESLTYNKDTSVFTVILDVGRNGEDLVSQTFTVKNANHTVPEVDS